MFKIQNREIFPLEGDKDFRVVIRPLGYADYSEVQIKTSAYEPSGGPDSIRSPVQESTGNYEFVKELFQRCIVSIHGCEGPDGKDIKAWDELLKVAPGKVVDNILKEIIKTIKAGEAELKN